MTKIVPFETCTCGCKPCKVIFRRFRRTKDGRTLDAHWYGKKAWPIHICDC